MFECHDEWGTPSDFNATNEMMIIDAVVLVHLFLETIYLKIQIVNYKPSNWNGFCYDLLVWFQLFGREKCDSRMPESKSSCVLLVFALSLNGFPYLHRRHARLRLHDTTLLRLHSRS